MPRMTAPSSPLDRSKRASPPRGQRGSRANHHPSRSPQSQSRSSPHPRGVRDGGGDGSDAAARGVAFAGTAAPKASGTKAGSTSCIAGSGSGSGSTGSGSRAGGTTTTGGGGSRGKKLRAKARNPKVGAERDEVDRALQEARAVRSSLQSDLLDLHLRESRDAVLKSGKVGGAATGSNRVFPRLPSNGSPRFVPPDFRSPTGSSSHHTTPSSSSSSGPHQPVTVRIRTASVKPNAVQTTVELTPPLYLQGAPTPPLPPSSATVFLRALVSSEDEQHLTHVPYFGDDDGEDVVSEYYDMEKRRRMMSAGPEYRAREVCALLDDTVSMLRERYHGGGEEYEGEVIERVQGILARELEVDVERVAKSWAASAVGRASHTAYYSSSSTSLSKSNSNLNSNSNADGSGSGGTTASDNGGNNAHPKDGGGGVGKADSSPSPTKKAAASNSKNSSSDKPIEYEHLMDSYRNLFCRRCFTYDCNMHGNITKAESSLQGELAVVREDVGYWDDVDFPLPRVVTLAEADDVDGDGDGDGEHVGEGHDGGAGAGEDRNGNGTAVNGEDGGMRTTTTTKSSTSPRSGGKRPAAANDGGGGEDEGKKKHQLTALQKSLCERLHLMFRGDVTRMARVAGAHRDAVASYVRERRIEPRPFVHVDHHPRPDRSRGSASSPPPDGGGTGGGGGGKKRRVGGGGQTKSAALGVSMKNYNAAWLKRVEGAEIHPLFIPCDHSGPCSEQTCSCVKNAAFCTKHCVWGPRSRNFFRGCACKAGRCQTKSCACFAARIECDPDLCRSCGACTDEPNRPATVQRCRNDNIGMRRHCHLLLAPSGIENAGWGIFTKHGLKRGDFVHEYVGEVISQEEAERRGRIYDKNNRSYLFNLSSDFVVDASRKGNKTKFANHSSRPNCYTKLVSVNGTARIGLFAQEDIEPQSELFFDYRYDVGMDNDLLHKPGMTVDWMKNPKMANQISKKNP